MSRVRDRRHSWGIFGVAAFVAATTVLVSPADARRRHATASDDYQPSYASIVVDGNSGAILQATNPDALRHPASLTKIMTLYLLFERLEAGKIKFNSELTFSDHATDQAPSKLGLKPGSTIDVETAIKAIVTKSANDVAVVVAEALAGSEEEFAKLMTRKARALGMKNTVYHNASGLPDDEQVTTARDQALLGRAIQERFPRFYKYFSTRMFVYGGNMMRNHNHLLGQVEGMDGIKTGYTRASGFNLVSSVRRGERHIVACVFGGRTARARDARMQGLIEEYMGRASTKRTAPLVAEALEKSEPRTTHAVATPRPAPAPKLVAAAPAASASIDALTGSTDPIKPRAIKTVTVKAAANGQIVAMTPASPSPQSAPVKIVPVAPKMAYAAEAEPAPTFEVKAESKTADLPPPPPGARPGVLGVLPIQVLSTPANAAPARAPAQLAAPAAAPTLASITPAPVSPPQVAHARGGWLVQVGALESENEAKQRLDAARNAAKILSDATPFTETVAKGDKTLYRARFSGLNEQQAETACKQLKRSNIACMYIRN